MTQLRTIVCANEFTGIGKLLTGTIPIFCNNTIWDRKIKKYSGTRDFYLKKS